MTSEFIASRKYPFESQYFGVGVDFHLENLRRCLPEMLRHSHFMEGNDDTRYKNSRSLFLVVNGDPLETMVEQKLVRKKDIRDETEFSSLPELLNYLGEKTGDGARVVSTLPRKISKVRNIYVPWTKAEHVDEFLFLPSDFFHYGRKQPLSAEDEMGTKTMAAIMLPQIFPEMETVIVKQSPYGNERNGTGMGVAGGFNKDGLRESMFYLRNPEQEKFMIHPALFGIDPKSTDQSAALLRTIVPVYRHYTHNGKVCDAEMVMQVDKNGAIKLVDYKTSGTSQGSYAKPSSSHVEIYL
jgi:hypothetical protein